MSYRVIKETTQSLFISGEDINDESIENLECVAITINIPEDEIADLLAEYDPQSGVSPKVAEARPIARTILDALKKHVEEESGDGN